MDSGAARAQRVEAILSEILEAPPEDRQALVDEACAGDPALRADVLSLLGAGSTEHDPAGRLGEALDARLEPAGEGRVDRLNAALEGRYGIERKLGEGGMATVYLARDERHHRAVAIKVLHPDLVGRGGTDRFLREIRVTAGLRHPNILPVLDSGEADGRPYYVMPLVEGESLRERLARAGALPIDDSLAIAAEVADALDAAHRAGVLHRDIKPANILLEGGRTIVADFGVAKGLTQNLDEGLTRTGASVGTPAYMSPEQGAGDARIDGRSDIYALGCVLYEMLAGEPPFSGPRPVSVLARHALDPVPDVRTVRKAVPEAVKQVLQRSLEKIPADRYASAAEFRDALRSPPEPVGVPPKRIARRSLRWSLAAGATVAAGGLAVYVTSNRPEPVASDGSLTALVWPFENRTGDPTLDALGVLISDRITERVQQAGIADMRPATSLPGAESTGDGSNADVVRSTSRDAGADLVVLGHYYLEGDSLRVSARLTDPEPSDLRRVLPAVSVADARPERGADEIASLVLGALALDIEPDQVLYGDEANGGRPPLWEALQAYREGLAAFRRGGGAREAHDHFRQAMALDVSFGSPALHLAMHEAGLEESRSISDRLNERREILGPRGLLRLDWVRAFSHGRWESVLVAGTRLAEGASLDDWYYIGVGYFAQGRYGQAVEAFDNIDPTGPVNSGFFTHKSEALHMIGAYEAELAFVREARAAGMEGLVRHELEAHAAMGNRAAVDSVIDAQARERAADVADAQRAMGLEFIAHGYEQHGRALLDLAITSFESSGEADDPANAYLYGMALGYVGRWEEARALWERVHDRVRGGPIELRGCGPACSTDFVDFYRAQTAAHLGISDVALGLSRQMPAFSRARVNAALGKREVAVALLKQAFEEGRPFSFYDHINPDFASLRGYPPYEDFVRPLD